DFRAANMVDVREGAPPVLHACSLTTNVSSSDSRPDLMALNAISIVISLASEAGWISASGLRENRKLPVSASIIKACAAFVSKGCARASTPIRAKENTRARSKTWREIIWRQEGKSQTRLKVSEPVPVNLPVRVSIFKCRVDCKSQPPFCFREMPVSREPPVRRVRHETMQPAGAHRDCRRRADRG